MRNIGYGGMGLRGLSDWLVIPLCPKHHTGSEGIHVLGIETWEKRFGTQLEMLHMINMVLDYDLFEGVRRP